MSNTPVALVIDDSPVASAVLSGLLRRQGLSVTSAPSGEEGLALAASLTPAIICLDLMLPNASGLEVCRRLRQLPATKATPIVMVSARPYPQDRAAALEAGADVYLQKPVAAHDVESTVRTLLWASRDRSAS